MRRNIIAGVVAAALAVVPVAAAVPDAVADAVARRATSSLSLTASDDVVRFGQGVRLVATLTGPPGGQTILIERLVGGEPTVVGGCVTGSAGRCSVSVRPRRSSTFRASFAGTGSWDASISGPVSVAVRAEVRGKLRGAYDRAGRYLLFRRNDRVTFVASVRPGRAGQRVWFPLGFNYGDGWRDGGTSSFRTDGDGRVLIYFAPGSLPAGSYRIRAVTRAYRGVLGAASRLVFFRVKR
jgi:hypothetical protein